MENKKYKVIRISKMSDRTTVIEDNLLIGDAEELTKKLQQKNPYYL